MAEMQDEVLDWDLTEADPDDGSHGGWTVLEDGFYPFTVQKMERARFEGSAKMPACPMAVLTLKVQGAGGEEALVTQRVYLLQRMLWKVTQFMEAIGQGRNERGKVVVNWGDVEGRGGWLKLKKRSYTNRDGQERETNDVDCFCKPEEHEKAWRAYAKQCGEDPDAALSAPAGAAGVRAPGGFLRAPGGPAAAAAVPAAGDGGNVPTPQPQAGASQHPGWGIQ